MLLNVFGLILVTQFFFLVFCSVHRITQNRYLSSVLSYLLLSMSSTRTLWSVSRLFSRKFTALFPLINPVYHHLQMDLHCKEGVIGLLIITTLEGTVLAPLLGFSETS